MSISEVVQYECDSTGYQVRKVYEGLSDEDYGKNIVSNAMTPAEMLTHMAECYVAVKKEVAGQSHEWGTFTIEDSSPAGIWSVWERERADAVQALVNGENYKSAHNFIVAHDAYHVGQMVLARLSLDSGWDFYSIYGFEG